MKNVLYATTQLVHSSTAGLKTVMLVMTMVLSVNSTTAQKLILLDVKDPANPSLASSDNIVKLQNIDTYEGSLKRYYSQKWQADRKEFQTVHKKKWWYYLPNIGWAFGLPTVTFGTSTLAEIDRDKVVTTAKLNGLDARAKYEYNEALLQLRTMHRLIVLEMEQLGLELETTKPLEGNIIKIFDDTFNDEKMKPLEHLQKNLEHVRFVLQLDEKNKVLVKKWLELEQFARYQMPDDSLSGEEVVITKK